MGSPVTVKKAPDFGYVAENSMSAFQRASAVLYDPYHGWETTSQPHETTKWCINNEDYRELASHAASALDRKASDFFERNGLTVMRVSQPAFHKTYERAEPDCRGVRLTFDQWVEKTRKEQALPYYPDIVYVTPCVKGLERSDMKSQFDNPNIHANKDFLRCMGILTGGSKPAQRRRSVERLGDLKASLIEDPLFGTTSRKDQIALPHADTGYRGLHATTTCAVDDGSEWEGVEITAELKLEMGGMAQDVQRLTRDIWGVRRATNPRHTQVQMQSGHTHYVSMLKDDIALNTFCRHAHNFVYEKIGLNILLLPDPKGKRKPSDYEAISPRELEAEMRMIASQGIRINNILSMNPIMPGLIRPAYQSASINLP